MSDHRLAFLALACLALTALGLMGAARRRTRTAATRANIMTWAHEAMGDLIALPGRLRAVATDPRTPRRARWLLVALAFYVASPIDLIPDFIPLLGQLDDVIVIAIALASIHRMIPDDVLADYFPERSPDER